MVFLSFAGRRFFKLNKNKDENTYKRTKRLKRPKNCFCFSCKVNKGFGGTLVDLKDKVLKECEDFHIWRRDISVEDEDGGLESWNTEEIDKEGK